jgi:hypothetical protein
MPLAFGGLTLQISSLGRPFVTANRKIQFTVIKRNIKRAFSRDPFSPTRRLSRVLVTASAMNYQAYSLE